MGSVMIYTVIHYTAHEFNQGVSVLLNILYLNINENVCFSQVFVRAPCLTLISLAYTLFYNK